MIIYHHLGLGDHLICYGLVMALNPTHLICKEINLPTVRDMYKYTGIELISVKDDKEAEEAVKGYRHKKIGFTDATMTEEKFGEEFYKQAGVDYETRWHYKINTEAPQVPGQGNFVHLPDKSIIRRVIKNQIVPDYSISPNIFGYKNIIENAAEVHVQESSFRQMIEFLQPKGKLYLHFDKEKSWRVVPSRHNWIVIR